MLTFVIMEKKIIYTENAPAPIGPYSQAVQYGNTLYISGQIPMIAQTGAIITDDIKAATKQVMENLQAILAAANATFEDVVKTSIFLTDMGQFGQVNEVYATYFTNDPPARETVQVSGLPRGVNVEISMIVGKKI
jgi:2-iminobutanoate/2-iminopropanoate deaminase